MRYARGFAEFILQIIERNEHEFVLLHFVIVISSTPGDSFHKSTHKPQSHWHCDGHKIVKEPVK